MRRIVAGVTVALAVAAVLAVPTTQMEGTRLKSVCNPKRKTSWSSTSKRRIGWDIELGTDMRWLPGELHHNVGLVP